MAEADDKYNCPILPVETTTTETSDVTEGEDLILNRHLSTTALLLFSSRGGLVLILNLYIAICVTSNVYEMVSKSHIWVQ